jgi:hypothetical protein
MHQVKSIIYSCITVIFGTFSRPQTINTDYYKLRSVIARTVKQKAKLLLLRIPRRYVETVRM